MPIYFMHTYFVFVPTSNEGRVGLRLRGSGSGPVLENLGKSSPGSSSGGLGPGGGLDEKLVREAGSSGKAQQKARLGDGSDTKSS